MDGINQFDVLANPFPRSRDRQPFLVALQSDLLMRVLDTVVVAPLEPKTRRPSQTASILKSRLTANHSC